MEIVPRYEGPVILTVGGDPAEVGAACVRQRQRLVATLAGLDVDAWRSPSRCAEWTVQDVAAHLAGVDQFWHWSIASGLAGTPTRLLEGFDPKSTPASTVDAARSATPDPADTLAALTERSRALCEIVAGLTGDQWATIAEAPAGHITVAGLVHHALWDCWVHERDIALPLGLDVTEEADEIAACLRFSAGLGPAFALQQGTSRPATLVVEATDPTVRMVVEVTDDRVVVDAGDRRSDSATVVVRGDAVGLVEAFSARTPLDQDVPAEHRWLVGSLAVAFETT
jgi:uncharacterized protein (TIGR03083 family)